MIRDHQEEKSEIRNNLFSPLVDFTDKYAHTVGDDMFIVLKTPSNEKCKAQVEKKNFLFAVNKNFRTFQEFIFSVLIDC